MCQPSPWASAQVTELKELKDAVRENEEGEEARKCMKKTTAEMKGTMLEGGICAGAVSRFCFCKLGTVGEKNGKMCLYPL